MFSVDMIGGDGRCALLLESGFDDSFSFLP